VGRPAAGSGAEADTGTPPRSTAPAAGAARYPLSRTRDPTGQARSAVAATPSSLRSRAECPRGRVGDALPRRTVLGASRSSAPGGGGGRANGSCAWSPRARDPRRQGDQPDAGAAWNRLGRPLPRPHPRDPARSQERPGLRAAKLAATRSGCTRARWSVVRTVVRRVAHGAGTPPGSVAGGCGSHLARTDRVAATRTHRYPRGTETETTRIE
jgi:hypothetical protein